MVPSSVPASLLPWSLMYMVSVWLDCFSQSSKAEENWTVSFILGKLLLSPQQNLKTWIKMYCGDYVSIMSCSLKSYKIFHCSWVVVTHVGTHFPLLVEINLRWSSFICYLDLVLGLLTVYSKYLKWKFKYKELSVLVS